MIRFLHCLAVLALVASATLVGCGRYIAEEIVDDIANEIEQGVSAGKWVYQGTDENGDVREVVSTLEKAEHRGGEPWGIIEDRWGDDLEVLHVERAPARLFEILERAELGHEYDILGRDGESVAIGRLIRRERIETPFGVHDAHVVATRDAFDQKPMTTTWYHPDVGRLRQEILMSGRRVTLELVDVIETAAD